MRDTRAGLGLRGKLLVLLLAFGVLPLAVVVVVGYAVSRSIITSQAERALREATAQQALHLGTELSRERLLLRTIAGQLGGATSLTRLHPERLAELLVQALPEGGVFDGLRVVTDDGRILTSVALRNAAPHWPRSVPAAEWTTRPVAVHREGAAVLAFLIAVPATPTSATAWLEGHVRAADFARVFSLPDHLMGGVELAVVDEQGAVITIGHGHAAVDLTAAFGSRDPARDSTTVWRTVLGGAPALTAMASVGGADWSVVAALPIELALAPLARLRDTTAAGAVVLVVVIVLTGLLTSRSVTQTLQDLTTEALRFGRSGSYHPVHAHGGDEVGHLVRAFNRMAADLQQSRQVIERLHDTEMERAQQLATVGELASGVAHEIRNPLTGVRGALDLTLRSLPLDEPSRPHLEEAQRQLARIDTTTTQLLRYARPPELRQVRVDGNELLARAVRVVDAEAGRAGVSIKAEEAPDLLRVSIDPELMIQVLVNLLLNAIAAAPRGSVVTIWAARHAPEAWIGVRDIGPGVTADLKDKIFRPFFTTRSRGTGLGLSVSRQIVTRHGGSIRVEDTPGGGATFVVALPLADEENDDD